MLLTPFGLWTWFQRRSRNKRERKREAAIMAAINRAIEERNAWRFSTIEALFALVEKLGLPNQQAIRAQLTEWWIEGRSGLVLVSPGKYLTVGEWHVGKGGKDAGAQQTVLILVVTDEIYAAVRGRPPEQWPIWND